MNGTNGNEPGYPEKALVPYPVILAATKGDPDVFFATPKCRKLQNIYVGSCSYIL